MVIDEFPKIIVPDTKDSILAGNKLAVVKR
jgi:hypothetical protein